MTRASLAEVKDQFPPNSELNFIRWLKVGKVAVFAVVALLATTRYSTFWAASIRLKA